MLTIFKKNLAYNNNIHRSKRAPTRTVMQTIVAVGGATALVTSTKKHAENFKKEYVYHLSLISCFHFSLIHLSFSPSQKSKYSKFEQNSQKFYYSSG